LAFSRFYGKIPKKIAYFAGQFYTQPMQSINANGYPIHFGTSGYEALNQLIAHQKYSSVFVIVTDSHSNDCCLPKFLPQLAVDIPIEIIEFESGEEPKTSYLRRDLEHSHRSQRRPQKPTGESGRRRSDRFGWLCSVYL
jgi:hypothetical protein